MNQPEQKNPSYEAGAPDISGAILSFFPDRAEWSSLISDRVQALIAKSSPVTIKNAAVCSDFIPPGSQLVAGGLAWSACNPDDNSVYEILADEIVSRNLPYPSCQWDYSTISELVHAVQSTYFGSSTANADTYEQRDDLYSSYDADGIESFSISAFRNTGKAMCLERAVIAHNLCHVLGVESVVICGLFDYRKQDDFGKHVFQIVKHQGNIFLNDVENPVRQISLSGSEENTPASYPLTKEQFADFADRKSIDVTHINIKEGESGYVPRPQERSYKLPSGRRIKTEILTKFGNFD